jgi:hypothetical protein
MGEKSNISFWSGALSISHLVRLGILRIIESENSINFFGIIFDIEILLLLISFPFPTCFLKSEKDDVSLAQVWNGRHFKCFLTRLFHIARREKAQILGILRSIHLNSHGDPAIW